MRNFSTRMRSAPISLEADRFYYDSGLRMLEARARQGPMFLFVYLAANHYP